MEQHEIELIVKYAPENEELRDLWEKHQEYERQVEKLVSKPFLTPGDELELKQIKKTKLAGKTRIQVILDSYQRTGD
ncbi:MAG: DUF465 domain-containing protein [Deltaproteobacteria bacterium]|nr:DUF465 domain-containing protein [Deltaproteobacteria bacterium]